MFEYQVSQPVLISVCKDEISLCRSEFSKFGTCTVVIFGILLEKTVGRHVKCYVVISISFAATMRQQ